MILVVVQANLVTQLRMKRGDMQEIEITPEMIKAGVGATLEFYDDEILDDRERVILSVFRAMVAASSESRAG